MLAIGTMAIILQYKCINSIQYTPHNPSILYVNCISLFSYGLCPLLLETAAHSWQPGPHCMASPSWPELTASAEASEPSWVYSSSLSLKPGRHGNSDSHHHLQIWFKWASSFGTAGGALWFSVHDMTESLNTWVCHLNSHRDAITVKGRSHMDPRSLL